MLHILFARFVVPGADIWVIWECCWCMFAAVGSRLCVKKIRSLKKVDSMVRRYDILNDLMGDQKIPLIKI
ncbi:hypothetical protein PN36_23280 [Candidatus Thiomargarita nelsonii]|uniref:Uncharacterized protein n=1 Tax=Candidatus Thiomargarita nelsonii TaxID=1003181 RepID=A0A0A6PJ44_9GAMM|nr:hypothetical protein PN36_23280 [Candidatus Thiomargarita nelsonii]